MAPLDGMESRGIDAPAVENVSRRFLLKGLVASGALVVGASLLPRRAFAAYAGTPAPA